MRFVSDQLASADGLMDPRNLKKWLALIAVVYLVFPRDLIPDFLGRGLGLVESFIGELEAMD